MNYGFVKVAAITTDIKIANVEYNTRKINEAIETASNNGAKIMVFPELCITGYTCGDLFAQDLLIEQAKAALKGISDFTRNIDALVFVGLPFEDNGKLYNVVAAINKGNLLGLTTKTYLPNYGGFYEMRQFAPGPDKVRLIDFWGQQIPFGPNILFQSNEMDELVVAVEVCEDLWAPIPTGVSAALEGATLIVNLSASNDVAGKYEIRRNVVKAHSYRLLSGYIFANSGQGESTTDVAFGGHNLIVENGEIISEAKDYENGILYGDLDIKRIIGERRKNTTFRLKDEFELKRIPFDVDLKSNSIDRVFSKTPFVPDDPGELASHCQEILQVQALGLKKRLEHTNAKGVVIGISGGLDSTLALLVANRTFEIMGRNKDEIAAVIMPGFGTTKRTYHNAISLSKLLGVKILEIPIKEAVLLNFKDINHDIEVHDITYENAQARHRTLLLMNLANKTNRLVIGTGNMSELALGWATYSGDHMSMYNVNVSVPKTIVRHLIGYEGDRLGKEGANSDLSAQELQKVLEDIIDTPISPELLPSLDGETAQKTEDLVGPYILHDYFLYYMLRYNYPPKKIYRIAVDSFEGDYDAETILKWLKVFYQRFFSQQFKRSCLPDGPKVGEVAMSPRGDLRMPSDACANLWLKDLDDML